MATDGFHVVVIEDDRDIALGLRILLERAGHRVERVPDGTQGLHLVRAARPDLVILDLSLPGLDGWQVLARLRALSDVPVLVLSAYCQPRDTDRALLAGADDFVSKPFVNRELIARVDALLSRVPVPV